MSNIIAVIWDCDRTLINGYMQDPMFRKFGVDPKAFWNRVGETIASYEKQGMRVNRDTYYLNQFIKEARNGCFAGLNNEMLREFGREQTFYDGVEEIFRDTRDMFKDDERYSEYGIRVEHYIVSTGFAEVIRGSVLNPYVDGIWGCELAESPDENGRNVINEVVYTIDNTTKTRAIFEINKGIGKLEAIEVNTKIPKELRRVQFENMIYIADGPSDIPAFSLVKANGGSTFAIYPKGNFEALRQVE